MNLLNMILLFIFLCNTKGACIVENFKYLVYTINNTDVPRRVLAGVSPHLEKTSSTQVKIIIHGWLDNCKDSYITQFKNLYLKNPDNVVIHVDWCKISKLDYDLAKQNSKYVANNLGDLLECLTDEGFDHNNIEIICFCMGCQIAGIASKRLINTKKVKIGRITALDPAGPTYFYEKEENRLGSCDATMVFVIHTDAFKFGFGDPCGIIDVYPNGGRQPQPGCPEGSNYIERSMCSHRRAIYYYLEALNDSNFYGIECPTYMDYRNGLCNKNKVVDFSETVNHEDSGLYFARTGNSAPFLKKKSCN